MWYVQPAKPRSDQSLCSSLDYSMSVKLLTEHHLEFLSLKGSCTGSSESTFVKMPHCWKSHVAANMYPVRGVRLEETDQNHIKLTECIGPVSNHSNS